MLDHIKPDHNVDDDDDSGDGDDDGDGDDGGDDEDGGNGDSDEPDLQPHVYLSRIRPAEN